MRDYEVERDRPIAVRRYDKYTTVGKIKPYNELLYALGEAAKALQHDDRAILQRLAWSLGTRGEVHACQVIMEHAKEPEPCSGYGMYGVHS